MGSNWSIEKTEPSPLRSFSPPEAWVAGARHDSRSITHIATHGQLLRATVSWSELVKSYCHLMHVWLNEPNLRLEWNPQ